MINKAKQTNKEVLESVLRPSEPVRVGSPCVTLRALRDYTDADAMFVLGAAGLKIREFASSLDFTHPDLPTLFNGTFNDATPFCKYVREMLEISVFCRRRQFIEAPAVVGDHSLDLTGNYEVPIIKEIASKTLAFSTKKAVRFVANPHERTYLREQKTIQPIDLASFKRRGFEMWNSAQSDFGKLARYRRPYEDEICQAKKKAERYLELGCTGMYAEVQKSIDDFQSQIADSYYGFNRVTLTGAALILARMMQYGIQSPSPLQANHKTFSLAATRCLFKDYDFGGITNNVFDYSPTIYPFHMLESMVSPEVYQIVSSLECFSGIGGKPIFDYYAVIVPGVDLPNPFDMDTKINMDKTLISLGLMTPAVIGEVDGKCYFLCYMV